MKIINMLGTLLAYLCIGTVLAVAIAGLTLWTRGTLTQERVFQILAVLYGHDLKSVLTQSNPDLGVPDLQVAYEEILEQRASASLDRDLRETALDKAVIDLRDLAQSLQKEKERFEIVRLGFLEHLDKIKGNAEDEALLEVKNIIEGMSAKQAKEHVLKMMEDGDMDQVVIIVKSMSPDKRKKMFAEFEDGNEPDRLRDILIEIRRGTGEGELIRKTRDSL